MTSFISVRLGCRADAGCKYWLRVRLVNGDMEEIDKREINGLTSGLPGTDNDARLNLNIFLLNMAAAPPHPCFLFVY